MLRARRQQSTCSSSRLWLTVGVHPTRCNEFLPPGEDPESGWHEHKFAAHADAHVQTLLELVKANRDAVVAVGMRAAVA